jgi:hypothetical protein
MKGWEASSFWFEDSPLANFVQRDEQLTSLKLSLLKGAESPPIPLITSHF